MGCKACCRCCFIATNVFAGIFGFIILAVGICVLLWQTLISSFLGSVDQLLLPALSGPVPGLNSSAPSIPTTDAASMVDAIMSSIGLGAFLLCLGLMLFILAFGCCGVCCCANNTCLLVYNIVVTVVFVGYVIGGCIMTWGYKIIEGKVSSAFQKLINEKFYGIPITTLTDILFHGVQSAVKCCGLTGYKNYDTAAKWNKTIEAAMGGGTKVVPVSCCVPNNNTLGLGICMRTPTSANSYFKTGCTEAVYNLLQSTGYLTYVYIGIWCPIVFVILALCLGWFLWKNARSGSGVAPAKMV